MYLYGHNRMKMNYGYEHIIVSSYIIYIEKATADLESKYSWVMCHLFAYKLNEY